MAVAILAAIPVAAISLAEAAADRLTIPSLVRFWRQ
jgi:hypothetical protein